MSKLRGSKQSMDEVLEPFIYDEVADVRFMSKAQREALLKMYESVKPDSNSQTHVVMIIGTGGDVELPNSFKSSNTKDHGKKEMDSIS